MKVHNLLAASLVAGLLTGCSGEKLFPTPYMFAILAGPGAGMVSPGVNVAVKDAEHRVDITIDGQPFTSYLWASQPAQAHPLPAHLARRHHAHARQPAPARRTHRPSPPHRTLVQLLQRQQHRLLEQLRRHQARRPRQVRLHRPRSHRLCQKRPRLRRTHHRIHLVSRVRRSNPRQPTSNRPSSTRPRATSSPNSPSTASPPAPSI